MLTRDKAALVVIDVQEKLFSLMHEKEALLDSLQRMIRGAGALGLPIVWAEQYPQGMGPTLPQLTGLLPGAPIPKKTFSCCTHPPLQAALDQTGREQLLLVGIEAHVCVYQTARGLLAQGKHVEVVADCVSSRTKANRKLGLQRIAQEGGRITSVEMALFELLGAAEGPAFKDILGIVK
jgi:nicotinamidase-related amidase